jgi:citrate synthase
VISALGVDLPLQKPDVRQAIAITAKVPTIVAGFQRMKQGQRPIPPNPELDHAANYLYMLTAQVPEEGKADAMDDYMICTADHGMNASTFAARVVASTFSDMYSAVVAAEVLPDRSWRCCMRSRNLKERGSG